jgi:hypothetical protein
VREEMPAGTHRTAVPDEAGGVVQRTETGVAERAASQQESGREDREARRPQQGETREDARGDRHCDRSVRLREREAGGERSDCHVPGPARERWR